jgi:hypothetical protein
MPVCAAGRGGHTGQVRMRGGLEEEGVPMQNAMWPKCRQCGEGDLVPLSDYGTDGAAIMYKAWVCTNPACGFNLKIHKGNLFINEPVNTRTHAPYTHQ